MAPIQVDKCYNLEKKNIEKNEIAKRKIDAKENNEENRIAKYQHNYG